MTALRSTTSEIRALGVTAAGAPRHPLYLRADARPRPWAAGAEPFTGTTER